MLIYVPFLSYALLKKSKCNLKMSEMSEILLEVNIALLYRQAYVMLGAFCLARTSLVSVNLSYFFFFLSNTFVLAHFEHKFLDI